MRILLVADIHGNFPALQAIREEFDVCLCLGDIVEYGPNPTACIDWCRRHATFAVRGNHDHGCVQKVSIYGQAGFRYLTMATRRPTLEMLSSRDQRYLSDLPTTQMVTLGRFRFFLVHATPRDPLDEYTPIEAHVWSQRLAGVKSDFYCVGHTHQQFRLPLPRGVVVNPGSVGLPRDGDPRARYAIIQDGQVELKQVEYDIDATIREVESSTFPPRAKELLAEVYRTGRYLKPVVTPAPPREEVEVFVEV
jgi:putative phosphoesterase